MRIFITQDVDEQPYSVDRMMTNLHLSGWLENASGIVFGRCTHCVAPSPSFTVEEVLAQKFAGLKMPIFTNGI